MAEEPTDEQVLAQTMRDLAPCAAGRGRHKWGYIMRAFSGKRSRRCELCGKIEYCTTPYGYPMVWKAHG